MAYDYQSSVANYRVHLTFGTSSNLLASVFAITADASVITKPDNNHETLTKMEQNIANNLLVSIGIEL
jgi:hypothetical protein